MFHKNVYIEISIYDFIFFVSAIYLSFKRNNGFNPESFILTCLWPRFYIFYVIVTAEMW